MKKYCLVFEDCVLIRTEVMTLVKETKTQITCKNVEGFTFRFFKDTGLEVGNKRYDYKYHFTARGIERKIVSYEESILRHNEMVTKNRKELEKKIKVLMDKYRDMKFELDECVELLSTMEFRMIDCEIIDLQERKKTLEKA